MNFYCKTAASLAAATMLAFGASAHATPQDEAVKLRKLDIMLMVGSLRCRFGADNFQDDYDRFSAAQRTTMAEAHQQLEAGYARELGANGAKRALDSLSVGMANQYGLGHPWLGCGALKSIAQDLADTSDRSRLLAAADYTLGAGPAATLAVAR